jgi:hypothetical protein
MHRVQEHVKIKHLQVKWSLILKLLGTDWDVSCAVLLGLILAAWYLKQESIVGMCFRYVSVSNKTVAIAIRFLYLIS